MSTSEKRTASPDSPPAAKRQKWELPSSSSSPTTTDPLQKRKDEEFHLLKIFPSEIWLKIADSIDIKGTHSEETNVLHNLSNSSSYFHTLLSSKRVQFLFPDVLPILKKVTTDPAVGMDLLKVRQVCTSWNRSMIGYYRFHPARRNLLSSAQSCDDLTTIVLSNPSNAEAFRKYVHKGLVDNLGRDSWNPCPFGYVLIKMTENDPDAGPAGTVMYWFGMLCYIARTVHSFGNHILYCKIVLPQSSLSPFFCLMYRTLTGWLRNMRNLRSLEICYEDVDYLPQADRLEDNAARFPAEVAECQIPTLAYLQCLKTSNVPVHIFNELLRSNGHVRNLHIVGMHPDYNLDQGNVDEHGERRRERKVEIS